MKINGKIWSAGLSISETVFSIVNCQCCPIYVEMSNILEKFISWAVNKWNCFLQCCAIYVKSQQHCLICAKKWILAILLYLNVFFAAMKFFFVSKSVPNGLENWKCVKCPINRDLGANAFPRLWIGHSKGASPAAACRGKRPNMEKYWKALENIARGTLDPGVGSVTQAISLIANIATGWRHLH